MARRVLIYLIVALITFCVILYLRNPGLFNDIWLWIVGLFGVIVSYIEALWNAIRAKFFPETIKAKKIDEPVSQKINASPDTAVAVNSPTGKSIGTSGETWAPSIDDERQQQITSLEKKTIEQNKYIELLEQKIAKFEKYELENEDTFSGTTLTLLRFIDDGETTLGLLYLNTKFYCYTLEDTFREEKITGKTRIPAGTYRILFNKNLTDLTKKYRAKPYTKGWFTWHLHLQNVPGFTGIYMHAGKNTGWTDGCILVSDDVYAEGKKKVLLNSEKAYERLYKNLTSDLEAEVPVRICVHDEQWFKNEIQNTTIL